MRAGLIKRITAAEAAEAEAATDPEAKGGPPPPAVGGHASRRVSMRTHEPVSGWCQGLWRRIFSGVQRCGSEMGSCCGRSEAATTEPTPPGVPHPREAMGLLTERLWGGGRKPRSERRRRSSPISRSGSASVTSSTSARSRSLQSSTPSTRRRSAATYPLLGSCAAGLTRGSAGPAMPPSTRGTSIVLSRT